MMTDDRIERTLESLRSDMTNVREAVAALTAQFVLWQAHNNIATAELAAVRSDLSKHAECDAAIQAEMKAEIRRLWWGIGIVATAFFGGIVTVLTKGTL